MTVEDAKKELKQYLQNLKYIGYKKQDIEELRCKCEKITTSISGMPSGSKDNESFSKKVISLTVAIEENEELLFKAEELRQRVEHKIEQIEQPYKNILHLCYIKGHLFKDIGKMIGYSLRQIERLHKEAVQFYKDVG